MSLLSINVKPNRVTCWTLSWFLFAAGIGMYFYTAQKRHKENPDDRVVPTLSQIAAGIYQASMSPDADAQQALDAAGQSAFERFRNGMLWKDTVASARRFFYGLALLFPAVLLGLHMGIFPYFGVFFLRFILFFDKIIALSVLPILFIAFGIDELSKIMLIVIGVTPTIILDTFNLTKSVPAEQVVKGFTLGAHDFGVAYRIVLKQILPRVINSIRLNLKPVMLFLFAGEMIASQNGLAFRIALLRRNMGMNVIIPYVMWVALLLFLVDLSMRVLNRKLHPWFGEA
jgi:NitT/TauT family transport system permease protein